MNIGFLFATSSRKIKSHVVESQTTLLVWPCLSHVDHFLMIQSVSFTSAAFKAFTKAYLSFLVSASAKNAGAIKFFGILKKYVCKNKINYCLKKKSNASLNKKVIFVFQTIFKFNFRMQIIYCVIHRCLYSLFILFLFYYISF